MEVKDIIVRSVTTLIIAIFMLFGGLFLCYFLTYSMIDVELLEQQMVFSLLGPGPFTPIQYDQMLVTVREILDGLGFYDPWNIQFGKYLNNMFTGNWHDSYYILQGEKVSTLITPAVFRLIEVMILPIILGITIGIILGRISKRNRYKWKDKVIQIFTIIGLAVPVFFLGIFFQYTFSYQLGVFDARGYKSITSLDPPFKTGFMILDSLLDGNWNLAFDIMRHYFLPGIVLTIAIIALVTRLKRSRQRFSSTFSNTLIIGMNFGLVFAYTMLIDVTFRFSGLTDLFLGSYIFMDFFVLIPIVFLFTIISILSIFILNLVIIILKIPSEEQKEQEIDIDQVRNPLNLKSPKLIIGLLLTSITLILTLFPEWISGFTLNAVKVPAPGAWDPPSLDHLLGQTKLGGDVLAIAIWGTNDAVVFGLGAVSIGLIGGSIFGVVGSLHRWVNKGIMGLMIVFYLLPGFLFLILVIMGFLFPSPNYWILMLISGILLIPVFTRAMKNVMVYKIYKLRRIFSYICLYIVPTILIYEALGFFGFFQSSNTINLGNYLNFATENPYEAFHAVFWPGFAITMIALGFLILHFELQDSMREDPILSVKKGRFIEKIKTYLSKFKRNREKNTALSDNS
ncbi:MAG: ABC transporter permease subunit [Promethearchaeota archaeon]|jgi:ABC-type dipeptide/oligopeptide/nickel transport system permease component